MSASEIREHVWSGLENGNKAQMASEAESQSDAEAGEEKTSQISYPTSLAPRGDTVDRYVSRDGKQVYNVPDPYRYMEDPDSEAIKNWVAAENDISSMFLKKCTL